RAFVSIFSTHPTPGNERGWKSAGPVQIVARQLWFRDARRRRGRADLRDLRRKFKTGSATLCLRRDGRAIRSDGLRRNRLRFAGGAWHPLLRKQLGRQEAAAIERGRSDCDRIARARHSRGSGHFHRRSRSERKNFSTDQNCFARRDHDVAGAKDSQRVQTKGGMIEEPYRWVEAIANRREYVETQLAAGSSIAAVR